LESIGLENVQPKIHTFNFKVGKEKYFSKVYGQDRFKRTGEVNKVTIGEETVHMCLEKIEFHTPLQEIKLFFKSRDFYDEREETRVLKNYVFGEYKSFGYFKLEDKAVVEKARAEGKILIYAQGKFNVKMMFQDKMETFDLSFKLRYSGDIPMQGNIKTRCQEIHQYLRNIGTLPRGQGYE